ncbi:MAG: fructosamine kinase family protein [Bacteroidota bacterium]
MEKNVLQLIADNLKTEILSFKKVGGGSINETGIIETGQGAFFVKINDSSSFPGLFEKEAKGLRVLRETGKIRVPTVNFFAESKDHSFLVMELIHRGLGFGIFWERFGKALASLHQSNSTHCGLDHDNYIGSLPQSNKQHKKFVDFFIHERLEPQFKLAFDKGFFSDRVQQASSRLYNRLPEILPDEPPSLIHGDLWSGNFMADMNDEPVLIDPAVCYAHREMDLAMTTLFGGFNDYFYESYESVFPTEPGLEKRISIYNLYYLLVHVNLFGGGYVSSVESIINRY